MDIFLLLGFHEPYIILLQSTKHVRSLDVSKSQLHKILSRMRILSYPVWSLQSWLI